MIKLLKTRLKFGLILLAFVMPFALKALPARADTCCPLEGQCSTGCACISQAESQTTIQHLWKETDKTIQHIKNEFSFQREWMVKVMFEQKILPSLMLFTEQITAMAMHQVLVIGTFMDAKHQLETQRLFQQMTAEAHKDYQPSEGMCAFGTNVRSLAASDRNADLTEIALAKRAQQRELLSGDAVAGGGETSDILSRLQQFRTLYCDKADNGRGLDKLCPNASSDKGRMNNDVNYSATLDAPLTLKLDYTSGGDGDHAANKHSQNVSADEEDIFALEANLYAHNVAPPFAPQDLVGDDGKQNINGLSRYMDIRALAAKRSVAQNSFAAIAAMKSQGAPEVQPYLYAVVKEMGISDADEIKTYLGDRPSYYAQMEVLTKKLYQNPTFYTELYDKPANVSRKEVAMQAIGLMQRRDMYRSMLRSESILSVMLETALADQQDSVTNQIRDLKESGDPLIKLPD